ncbi:uncharacterized protein LOC129373785 [Poeciliopsis prolifica]|uniref:uncharacterized protein LOC129373785 n=1 Tax=Poeciliopsis prolifica TaxID=188132 RepID=UPI0024139B0E|nr:uncharacterized protein LOC129373785 [Poeciliopsis prolifica]
MGGNFRFAAIKREDASPPESSATKTQADRFPSRATMSNGPESSEESQIKVLVLGRDESGKESVVNAMRGQFNPEESSENPKLTRGTVCLEDRSIKVSVLNASCVCCKESKEDIQESIKKIKKDIRNISPGPHVIIWVSKERNEEKDKLLSAFHKAFHDKKRVLFVPIGDEIPEKDEKTLTFTESEEWGKTLLERVVKINNDNNSKPCEMNLLEKKLDKFSKQLVNNFEKSERTETVHTCLDALKDWSCKKFFK